MEEMHYFLNCQFSGDPTSKSPPKGPYTCLERGVKVGVGDAQGGFWALQPWGVLWGRDGGFAAVKMSTWKVFVKYEEAQIGVGNCVGVDQAKGKVCYISFRKK